MSLTITSRAAAYMKEACTQATQGTPWGIRLSVKKAGCSGYEYVVEYAYNPPKEDDLCFEHEGAKVVVDPMIVAKYLKGTEIDYQEELTQQGLVFNNPNATAHCGCGESFTMRATGDA